MFKAFSEVKKEKSVDPVHKEIESFKRNLADARKLLLPKEKAVVLKEMADKVFPEARYEEFMRNHMGDPKRVEKFKKAIDRRLEAKFKVKDRRAKLVKMLQKEGLIA